MLIRILTGVVLAPLLIMLVLWGPWWGLLLLFVAAGAVALDEIYRILLSAERSSGYEGAVGVAVGSAAIAATNLLGPAWVPVIFGLAAMAVMTGVLLRTGDIQTAGRRMAALLAGLAYVGMLFAVLALYPHLGDPMGRHALLLVFLAVWGGDTFAYFAGRSIGGPKLYAKVSPKKTWAGGFGGLAGSMVGATIAWWLFFEDRPLGLWLALGAAVGVVEQVGDFCESLFKRSFDVKDSGKLLPGHGGMLDRVDGLLFAAPVVYGFLWALER